MRLTPPMADSGYRGLVLEDSMTRLADRFGRLVQAHPDFELVAPVSDTGVRFRAIPFGLDGSALDQFNADLLERVNATGELALDSLRLEDRYVIQVPGRFFFEGESSVARAWDVITDAFRGMLIDSSNPLIRWDFGRLAG